MKKTLFEKMIQKPKFLICLLAALLTFTSLSPTVHAADESNEDRTLSPYFIIQNEDASVDSFPLKATDVTVNINGMIAEIYVTQTYANEGYTPINARYVFPTSSNAAVHGMKMEIGNNVVTAKIKEKEEAKKEYETAKSEGKSASLLEQQRPNVFTMDVANIMPGDTAKIELYYTELIYPTEGIYEFIFPTVVGPRYVGGSDTSDSPAASDSSDTTSAASVSSGDTWTATPYLPAGETPPGEYNITVNLSTGVPIAELSCKSHEISVTNTNNSNAQVTLANPEDYAGNRDFILKYKLTGEDIQSGLVLTGNDTENFFMLTVQPPEHYTVEEIPPREYIFILDVSGSMFGYPLETGKTLIRDLVSGLNETDTFNVVLFANESAMLSSESVSPTTTNIEMAMRFIDEQEGYGGTALAPALRKAIALPKEDNAARSIVLITDGYISNEQDIFEIIDQNMDTASFFSFGIGSSVNDYLIEGIAKSGMGESFIVTDSEDAAESAERFRTYIEAPLLTDIKIAYEGFEVYDVEPSAPSILYAQKPIVLFGKWKGNPAGTIKITGKSGTQDYAVEIPVENVTIEEDCDAIRYLWARTKLDRIAGYGSTRNDASTKAEITKLGLEYNLTTPYTSFIAVIDTIRNTTGESTDVDQASPLPLNVSNLAVGGGYTSYSEPGTILLIIVFCGATFLSTLRRKNRRCHAA